MFKQARVLKSINSFFSKFLSQSPLFAPYPRTPPSPTQKRKKKKKETTLGTYMPWPDNSYSSLILSFLCGQWLSSKELPSALSIVSPFLELIFSGFLLFLGWLIFGFFWFVSGSFGGCVWIQRNKFHPFCWVLSL